MRDLLGWNVSLGRWRGVQVHLHVFFVLLAIVTLHYAVRADLVAYAAVALGLLLVSAAAHELAHCLVARRSGGVAERVVLWPFGGLMHVNVTQEPQLELLTALAGPATNGAICLVLSPLVIAAGGEFGRVLNPLTPPVPMGSAFTVADVARLAFWLNWLLMVVNLLPAYPLDGSRALRAVLWEKVGFRLAVQWVGRAAAITALVLAVSAWMVRDSNPEAPLPLAILAAFLFFAARQEVEQLRDGENGDPMFQYDFSQGYTSLEGGGARSTEPGPFRRWLERRRAEREARRTQIEQDEERRVDEVLARLHDQGRDALSPADRALLDRVSARYRNRQQG